MEYLGQPLIRISEDIYCDCDLKDLEDKEVILEEENEFKYIIVLRSKPVRTLVEDNKYYILIGDFDKELSCTIIIDNINTKSIDMIRHRYTYNPNQMNYMAAFYDNSIIFKIQYKQERKEIDDSKI